MSASAALMAESAGKIAALNGLERSNNPFDGEIENHHWDMWDSGFTQGQERNSK